MIRIEAIAIGTELLTTSRVDTNSIWIAQELASLGLAFHRKTAVGDDREVSELLRLARVLCACEIDKRQGLVPLPAGRLDDDWQKLSLGW